MRHGLRRGLRLHFEDVYHWVVPRFKRNSKIKHFHFLNISSIPIRITKNSPEGRQDAHLHPLSSHAALSHRSARCHKPHPAALGNPRERGRHHREPVFSLCCIHCRGGMYPIPCQSHRYLTALQKSEMTTYAVGCNSQATSARLHPCQSSFTQLYTQGSKSLHFTYSNTETDKPGETGCVASSQFTPAGN